MRVLVAEKDPNGRRLLEQVLKLEGHEVLSADDGDHARDLLSTFAPDVVLMNMLSSLPAETASPVDQDRRKGSPVVVMALGCAENLLSNFMGKDDEPDITFDRLSSRTKIDVVEHIQHFCGALSRCRDVCARVLKPESICGSALDGLTVTEFTGKAGQT